jgi:glycogen operon protein
VTVTERPERSDGPGDRPALTRPIGPVDAGWTDPIGATLTDDGVAFCVYSRHATAMELLLFDAVDGAPTRTIRFDPVINRTADYWHVAVPGLRAGQLYAFSADGPWDPMEGQRFDSTQVLLDPYGRAVATPAGYRRLPSGAPGDPTIAMKSVVVDTSAYDWEGDRPLGHTWRETLLYEAHLRGFTADPSSGLPADRRGTYAGFIEKIPYLVDLGITAVELLPVFAFDRLAAPPGRVNYWGYQPVGFFAPHEAYASRRGLTSAVDEFRDLVKALHRAGIEVILDVVYNHTAEIGADGPTFGFRGLANDDYYLLDESGDYLDYSGTGNTFNANRPIVRRLIVDSLRYWVEEMHVDGFRFDLAAVLSRDETGQPMADPPILWDIETDPVLAGTKLIAEAWDAGGLYQVGSFVGERWVEWNGRFRDDVRSFVKSDAGMVPALMQRLLGSPDIYGHKRREPQASVNFVTCHDGFTLNDLVSYDVKHNESNGEDNRDGNDQNLSWNGGVEGPTDDPAIVRLRARQVRNFLAIELLSLGAPMLLMGDEVRRTQGGNNNAYGHDDPTSWFDWTAVEREAGLLRFTKGLVALRRRLAVLLDMPVDAGLLELLAEASLEWGGVHPGQPDTAPDSRSVALTLRADAGSVHVIFNAYWEPLEFELPAPDAGVAGWRRIIDTTLDSPEDVVTSWDAAVEVAGSTYPVGPRSVVVLATRRSTDAAPPRRAT